MGEHESIIATLVDEIDLVKERKEKLENLLEQRLDKATKDAEKDFKDWLKIKYNTTLEELEEQKVDTWGTPFFSWNFYVLYRSIAWITYDDSIPEE